MRQLAPLLLICSSILVFFLDGCAPHQIESAQLNTDLPRTYQSPPPEKDADFQPTHWWEIFSDEELNTLMAKTISGNLDLAQFAARLQQALALNRQRSAERMPYLNLNASTSRARQVSADGENVGHSHSYSLAAGYEVDLWNKLKSKSLAQELQTAATRQDLYALYLTLSAQVAENYFLMVEQRAKLTLIDQTIAVRKDNLELVELRYREGVVSALDLYQARQNLANARSQRPDAEAALVTTAHALAVLTGDYPTIRIGGRLAELPDIPDSFPMGLPSDLLQLRPDIQSAMLRLQSADYQIAVAVAERFPSINLLAEYGHSESDFGTLISGTLWSLIGNLTMPLVDFDKRKAEVERNKAVYAERLADYQQTVLTAFQEVEDALVENRSSRNAIVRISIEVSAAQDALRLSKSEYMDGLSTYLPVLTAQTTHFDSQIRLLSARRRMISARISLARAMGGNWMTDMAEKRIQASRK